MLNCRWGEVWNRLGLMRRWETFGLITTRNRCGYSQTREWRPTMENYWLRGKKQWMAGNTWGNGTNWTQRKQKPIIGDKHESKLKSETEHKHVDDDIMCCPNNTSTSLLQKASIAEVLNHRGLNGFKRIKDTWSFFSWPGNLLLVWKEWVWQCDPTERCTVIQFSMVPFFYM